MNRIDGLAAELSPADLRYLAELLSEKADRLTVPAGSTSAS